MEGTVIQFRRGRKTYKPRHFLIEVADVDSRDAAKVFVGKKVSWKSPGKVPKVINGIVSSAHGNNGVIRAIFERGLPGQSVGTSVEIEDSTAKKTEKPKATPNAVKEVKEEVAPEGVPSKEGKK